MVYCMHAYMALRIQITKLKIRQYLLRANSPNLMLTKFSHYTVCDIHDFTSSIHVSRRSCRLQSMKQRRT